MGKYVCKKDVTAALAAKAMKEKSDAVRFGITKAITVIETFYGLDESELKIAPYSVYYNGANICGAKCRGCGEEITWPKSRPYKSCPYCRGTLKMIIEDGEGREKETEKEFSHGPDR